jgi:CDP-diacylglycerol pyrophosphatase
MVHRRTSLIVAAFGLVAAVLMLARIAQPADPNALWRIVHDKCVPNEEQHGDPGPCVEVAVKDGADRGYAVLKDLYGVTQFLLIPTKRITGIESPDLLEPDAPNYFAEAWRARSYVAKALGHAIPADDLSLAINSEFGRSQNQLHIHIDCIRADVRQTLDAERGKIGPHWAALDQPLGGHSYLAMRIDGPSLAAANPFKLLADGVPGARDDMGARTLVAVAMDFGDQTPGFALLTDRADRLHGDFAEGAALQDHDCKLAR